MTVDSIAVHVTRILTSYGIWAITAFELVQVDYSNVDYFHKTPTKSQMPSGLAGILVPREYLYHRNRMVGGPFHRATARLNYPPVYLLTGFLESTTVITIVTCFVSAKQYFTIENISCTAHAC